MQDSKNSSLNDYLSIHKELKPGGNWLGKARQWIQLNVPNGDTTQWDSDKLVTIPFNKLEEFALKVAVEAVYTERLKAGTIKTQNKDNG